MRDFADNASVVGGSLCGLTFIVGMFGCIYVNITTPDVIDPGMQACLERNGSWVIARGTEDKATPERECHLPGYSRTY